MLLSTPARRLLLSTMAPGPAERGKQPLETAGISQKTRRGVEKGPKGSMVWAWFDSWFLWFHGFVQGLRLSEVGALGVRMLRMLTKHVTFKWDQCQRAIRLAAGGMSSCSGNMVLNPAVSSGISEPESCRSSMQ